MGNHLGSWANRYGKNPSLIAPERIRNGIYVYATHDQEIIRRVIADGRGHLSRESQRFVYYEDMPERRQQREKRQLILSLLVLLFLAAAGTMIAISVVANQGSHSEPPTETPSRTQTPPPTETTESPTVAATTTDMSHSPTLGNQTTGTTTKPTRKPTIPSTQSPSNTTTANPSVEPSSLSFPLPSRGEEEEIKFVDGSSTRLNVTLLGEFHFQDGGPSAGRVFSVAFHEDSQRLLVGGCDGTGKHQHLKIYNLTAAAAASSLSSSADTAVVLNLVGHSHCVLSARFHPNGGNFLASASRDAKIYLWNVQEGKLLQTLVGHSSTVTTVAWHPDGSRLASGSWDDTLRLWNFFRLADSPPQTLFGNGNLYSLAFDLQGTFLASARSDGLIRLWNGQMLPPLELQRQLAGHSGAVKTVAFSPNGKFLASGSDDTTVRLWSLANDKDKDDDNNDDDNDMASVELRGHLDWVESVAWSPDSRFVVSGSLDGTVRVWDVFSGEDMVLSSSSLGPHNNETTNTPLFVKSVDWSSNGRYIVAGAQDNRVVVWEVHPELVA